mmetsp:Transcript_773/g.2211  ORF Transcript_773/g.2211 Transcript_773/m.2211 type:complete len:332 (+) Transcript_773:140-1135(+)
MVSPHGHLRRGLLLRGRRRRRPAACHRPFGDFRRGRAQPRRPALQDLPRGGLPWVGREQEAMARQHGSSALARVDLREGEGRRGPPGRRCGRLGAARGRRRPHPHRAGPARPRAPVPLAALPLRSDRGVAARRVASARCGGGVRRRPFVGAQGQLEEARREDAALLAAGRAPAVASAAVPLAAHAGGGADAGDVRRRGIRRTRHRQRARRAHRQPRFRGALRGGGRAQGPARVDGTREAARAAVASRPAAARRQPRGCPRPQRGVGGAGAERVRGGGPSGGRGWDATAGGGRVGSCAVARARGLQLARLPSRRDALPAHARARVPRRLRRR